MLIYLVYTIFIISVAMAAAGVILTARLQKQYSHELFSPLLYYQVFIYAFGFYGIWGQVILRSFLPAYITGDILAKVCDIALLIGLPFGIFAWLMLIRFSSVLTGSKRDNWFFFWFLLINILILFAVGLLTGKTELVRPMILIKQYYLIASFIYTTVAAVSIYFSVKTCCRITSPDKKRIASGMFLVMILQTGILIFLTTQAYIGILFILAYFVGNTFIPAFVTYGMKPVSQADDPPAYMSFDEFCSRYDISPRETDIIREICNGLSNKEISEKLFITVQTVKDHTHRIYIKTNVKSRAQLMNLVKDFDLKK